MYRIFWNTHFWVKVLFCLHLVDGLWSQKDVDLGHGHYLLPVWLRANYFTSLSLNFYFIKSKKISEPPHGVEVIWQFHITIQGLIIKGSQQTLTTIMMIVFYCCYKIYKLLWYIVFWDFCQVTMILSYLFPKSIGVGHFVLCNTAHFTGYICLDKHVHKTPTRGSEILHTWNLFWDWKKIQLRFVTCKVRRYVHSHVYPCETRELFTEGRILNLICRKKQT